MWNVLRKLFNVPEPVGTVVRLDDLEISDGDKLCLFYRGRLSPERMDHIRSMFECGLGNDRKQVLIFDGDARLQVIRNGSKLHKLMDGMEKKLELSFAKPLETQKPPV